MKKRLTALRTIAAATLLAAGVMAQASPVIRLSDGSTTVTVHDGDALDLNSAAGAVTFVGAVGSNWMTNTTNGLAPPVFSDPHLDLTSVHATNVGVGGISLDVWLTDTSFQLSSLPGMMSFISRIGGTTNGMVTWTMYVDDNNTEFGTQHQIATGTNPTAAFSDEVMASALVDGTFSMTLHVRINHGNGQRTTSFNFEGIGQLVPEPGTMALLGAALLGFGLRRRQS